MRDDHVLTLLPRRTRGWPVHPLARVEYDEDARGLCSCGWTSPNCFCTDEVVAEHSKHTALMAEVGA